MKPGVKSKVNCPYLPQNHQNLLKEHRVPNGKLDAPPPGRFAEDHKQFASVTRSRVIAGPQRDRRTAGIVSRGDERHPVLPYACRPVAAISIVRQTNLAAAGD